MNSNKRTMESERPNPDALLQEANLEQNQKGKLKIYFGACAGVGKTYAMLQAAQDKLKEGAKVVVGIIETHGRVETAKAMEGIPRIALKAIEYQGIQIHELDVDTAIAQKPDILLVDELAHSNPAGSRHPKRWQDIQEILDCGIDVYTTLNVQHLESLNDIVFQISGIKIKETVPDSIFDHADEIVLVDIPSEVIIERLNEGKVYLGEFAKKRAAQHFFKLENLISLREIALRRTAERVDAQRSVYKSTSDKTKLLSDRILVCVSPSSNSVKLIRHAKQLATKLKCPWIALYVENDEYYNLSSDAQRDIKGMLNLATSLGAKSEIIQNSETAQAITEYAQTHQITKLILGQSEQAKWKKRLFGSLTHTLIDDIQSCNIYIISEDVGIAPQPVLKRKESLSLGFGYATLITIISTLLGLPAKDWLEPQTALLIYIAGIVIIATSASRATTIFAVLLAAFCYNFFFIAPYYQLGYHDFGDFVTLCILLLTSLVISSQTYRLRQQTINASQRERFSSHLLELSRKLIIPTKRAKIAEILSQHVGELFKATAVVWLSGENELPTILAPNNITIDLKDESLAQWVFKHNKKAGIGTDTMPSASGYFYPINYGKNVYGVLGILKGGEAELSREQDVLIEALLLQVGLALQSAK